MGRKMRMNYDVYCKEVMEWVKEKHEYSSVFRSMVTYQLYKDFDVSEIAYKLKDINFE